MSAETEIFYPAEGALLDLESLHALSRGPATILEAWLAVHLPQTGGVVLSGLEPVGEPELSSVGSSLETGVSPGSRRVISVREDHVTISPGLALLSDGEGRRYIVHSPQPLLHNWPPSRTYNPEKRAVLVAQAAFDPIEGAGVPARRNIRIHLRYIPEANLRQNPIVVPIAMPMPGNQEQWACDLSRFLSPEDPTMRALLLRLAQLQLRVWTVSAADSVFNERHGGGEWTQRQMQATAALQSARMALAAHPTHTTERIRILGMLMDELQRSIEQLATELKQILGGTNAMGPYADLCVAKPRGP